MQTTTRRALGPFETVRELTFDAPFPHLLRVRQHFDAPVERDPVAATRRELEPLRDRIRPGMSVAVTAGSRGISDIATAVRTVGDWLREAGAEPFVVPAMGSHGGATPEGQIGVLASLGITEETMGMPIRSSMETVELAGVPDGPKVHLDGNAAGADGIVLVNRVKPHTDFDADVESGLAKLTAIGLGKQRGAETIHAYGAVGLGRWVPRVAQRIVREANVLGGVAILENAFEQTARIAFVPPEDVGGDGEAELLAEARGLMGRLPFDELDVLVVDEMGKDKSGAGLDTNVINRLMIRDTPEPQGPPHIRNIVALDLTDASHGNAAGIGLPEFITFRLLEKIDLRATYINSATAGICGVQRAQIPMALPTDRDAIAAALLMSGRPDPENARLVRIQSTLDTADLLVSSSLREEVDQSPVLDVTAEAGPMRFDDAGTLAGWGVPA
ncbi:MAG: hypothetical protein ACRDN9_14215 [Streptosporangiaceae bacterium]